MAFVKRENKESSNDSTSNNRHKNSNNSHTSPLNSLEVIKNMKAENTDAKEQNYYLERSKVILNHLEATRGFDFYDPDRRGGMHLNDRKKRGENGESNEKEFIHEGVNSEAIKALLEKAKLNNKNIKNK